MAITADALALAFDYLVAVEHSCFDLMYFSGGIIPDDSSKVDRSIGEPSRGDLVSYISA